MCVCAYVGKFDPGNRGRLQYSEMVALVRATEGATLDLTSFEEIAGYIGADATKGLSLQVGAGGCLGCCLCCGACSSPIKI